MDSSTSIIIGLVTLLMPVITLVANNYIKRQENEAKNDMRNSELLQSQLTATTAAKDRLDTEFREYKAKMEAKLEVLNDTVSALVSQVHTLELWVSKNNIPPAPKWEQGNDSATHISLGGK